MPVYSEDLRVKVVEYLKKGHTHNPNYGLEISKQ